MLIWVNTFNSKSNSGPVKSGSAVVGVLVVQLDINNLETPVTVILGWYNAELFWPLQHVFISCYFPVLPAHPFFLKCKHFLFLA